MPYDRNYTVEEVKTILDSSEHRVRPGRSSGFTGHAIAMHTNERQNVFSRPDKRKDSIFAIARISLVPIIHEVLNSPSGQRALKLLNSPSQQDVQIDAVILRQNRELDIFTVYRPPGRSSQTSFDWLSTSNGDGYIVQIFMLVVKLPGSSSGIHLQTAYPKHYARTMGDDIIFPKT